MQVITSDRAHWFIWLIAYTAMVGANGMANSMRWGGITTGEVSAIHPSLFTPAGFTFSIWGLIYLSLAIFIFASWHKMDYWRSLTPLFVTSCGLNILWLFTWHHNLIGLSTFLIFIFLAVLSGLYIRLSRLEIVSNLGLWRFPWSIYTAWLCVASIANTAIWLVSSGFHGAQQSLTIAVVLVALALGHIFITRQKDLAFAGVLIWAFIGIISARSPIKEDVPWLYGVLIGAVSFLLLSILRSLLPQFRK